MSAAEIPISKSKEALREIANALKQLDDKRRYSAIDFYVPYPKQRDFFDMGSVKAERLLSAGNQQGKSHAGAAEMAYHLTGLYPDDWLGRRWRRPIKAWVCGESTLVVRDVQQAKLCGEPGLEEAFGTGMIPRRCFEGKPSLARGITDAFDTIHVKHYTDGIFDGISVAKFKSYEQGRAKFQGQPIDLIWDDEEPAMDIYTECLARLAATDGSIYTTFTPMQGTTQLWIRFATVSPDRGRVLMTIKDAKHVDTPEKLAKILARYPAHEHQARINGMPMMGQGRVFTTDEGNIAEPLIMYIPPAWTKLWSIDFGIGHPFAAILSAWDRDNDVIHILDAYRIADQTPVQHAVRMKKVGIIVPVAWPQDGTAREKSGAVVADLYRDEGLKMLDEHATFEEGGYGTEAGVLEMHQRFESGRLKVAAHLSEWFEEYREYHRKDGIIVKERDDLMSATRIGVMAKRFGKPVQLGGTAPGRSRRPQVAQGLDFDPFTGQ